MEDQFGDLGLFALCRGHDSVAKGHCDRHGSRLESVTRAARGDTARRPAIGRGNGRIARSGSRIARRYAVASARENTESARVGQSDLVARNADLGVRQESTYYPPSLRGLVRADDRRGM